MRITPQRLMLAMAVAVAAAWAWASSPKASSWDELARHRKAEYTALQAASAYALDDYDDFILLARRAYALDPSDPDNGFNWGLSNLMQDNDVDSATVMKSYHLMLSRFMSDPNNYEQGVIMASLAKDLRRFGDLTRIWEMLDSAFPIMNQPAEELAQTYLINSMLGDSSAYDRALQIYDRLEAGQGKNIGLSSQKIRAYALHQDTAAIINEVQALLDYAPKDTYVAMFAGGNYEYLKDLSQALKYYTLATDLDPANGRAYMAKADVYLQLNDSVNYDHEVFLALNNANLEAEAKVEILKSYVSKLYQDPTQEDRIRELFSTLEEMHPGTPELHLLYAAYLNETGYKSGAAEELSFAVALDPTDEQTWMQLAQLQFEAENNQAAIKTVKDGIERFPDNFYLPILGAFVYKDMNELGQAVALLDSVKIDEVRNYKGVSSFLTTKADFHELVGDTAVAYQLYAEAIDLDPENAMALNNFAYKLAVAERDLDKAEQYSSRTLRLDAENPTYLDTYAWVQFKKKDYSLAKQYIDMALRNYIDGDTITAEEGDDLADSKISAEVYEHAGDIYFFNGDRDKAIEFWKKALALDAENKILGMKVKHGTYFYDEK